MAWNQCIGAGIGGEKMSFISTASLSYGANSTEIIDCATVGEKKMLIALYLKNKESGTNTWTISGSDTKTGTFTTLLTTPQVEEGASQIHSLTTNYQFIKFACAAGSYNKSIALAY